MPIVELESQQQHGSRAGEVRNPRRFGVRRQRPDGPEAASSSRRSGTPPDSALSTRRTQLQVAQLSGVCTGSSPQNRGPR